MLEVLSKPVSIVWEGFLYEQIHQLLVLDIKKVVGWEGAAHHVCGYLAIGRNEPHCRPKASASQ